MNKVWVGILEETPIGPLWLATAATGVVAIGMQTDEDRFAAYLTQLTEKTPVLTPGKVTAVAQQLAAYFSGERRAFDLPLCWDYMTAFQRQTLQTVNAIPFGQLRTYSDIAREMGKPKAVRAVGRANATNPIPILIPCHRVIGSDGRLHGYATGLETKAQLLRIEGSWLL